MDPATKAWLPPQPWPDHAVTYFNQIIRHNAKAEEILGRVRPTTDAP